MGSFARECVSPVAISGGGLQAGQRVPASFRQPAEPHGAEHLPVFSPTGALPSGHSRGVLVRCRGKGGRPAMAVTTGFQGRTFDVPRTGVPCIDPPRRAPCAAADAVFADAKAFLSSSEARRMSESELERELHRRGQELVRKLLQGHRDQRSPKEAAGPAEGKGTSGVECSEPPRARKPRRNGLRHDAGCGSGLRAARSRRLASARCRAEPAAGALPGRDAPPRDHRDRLAGTTAYALEATVVLDIIHVAAATRRAVLVAGSSKGLSAFGPRSDGRRPAHGDTWLQLRRSSGRRG